MKLTLAPRNPPRLAIRTLVATSVAIGLVLVSVFVVLSISQGRLFGRRVFKRAAVQWVVEHVPE